MAGDISCGAEGPQGGVADMVPAGEALRGERQGVACSSMPRKVDHLLLERLALEGLPATPPMHAPCMGVARGVTCRRLLAPSVGVKCACASSMHDTRSPRRRLPPMCWWCMGGFRSLAFVWHCHMPASSSSLSVLGSEEDEESQNGDSNSPPSACSRGRCRATLRAVLCDMEAKLFKACSVSRGGERCSPSNRSSTSFACDA